ncbi:MAG TPA: cupin domain-containing protein [Terracidiphilus sp.]|nr:cupin domain-containing protein [Terracidiphilus sp.]
MNPTELETAAPDCRILKSGESFIGKQGLQYNVAISAETVSAQAIHMQLVTIPPGGRARAHKHATHETAIYALTGTSHMWYGPRLERHVVLEPGNFLYIPADMPHLPYNPSLTEPVTAVIARTDPNEQESVVLLPELDSIHPA